MAEVEVGGGFGGRRRGKRQGRDSGTGIQSTGRGLLLRAKDINFNRGRSDYLGKVAIRSNSQRQWKGERWRADLVVDIGGFFGVLGERVIQADTDKYGAGARCS